MKTKAKKRKKNYWPTPIISYFLRSLNYIFSSSSSIISFDAIEMVAGPCDTTERAMENQNGMIFLL